MPNEDIGLLHRYLRVGRRHCEFVSEPLHEMLRFFAAKSFPDINLNCEFVPVRSKNRLCEFRTIGSTLFVVIDLELSDRLMELDLLVQVPQNPDWVYTFTTALLSDVFRQQRDFERYRYCVLKVLGDHKTLKTLRALPKGAVPLDAAIIPVLLHEVAHVLFRRGESFVDMLGQLCQASLDRFANATAEQVATGRHPVPDGNILGVPFEQYDQARLKEQLIAYTATIRNNKHLIEELTCDFIAAIAFVNYEAGISCFKDIVPSVIPLSPRQLGDVFYFAIKTSRYLQFLSSIQEFGFNASSGEDRLSRTMIEMTARTNALTHLLLNLFQSQLETSTLLEKPDFGKPVTREQISAAMHHSIARLMRNQHEQLLGPFDKLMEFFLSPVEFGQDNRKVMSLYGETIPASIEDVDYIRMQLPL